MSIYEIVKLGKEKQGIASDRAYAIKNGLTEQNISDLKAGRARNPNALNFLRIAKSAGLTIDEAILFLEEKEKGLHKQAGFATMPMMLGTLGITSAALVTYSLMSHYPLEALSGAVFSGFTLYIMLNERIRKLRGRYRFVAKIFAWLIPTLRATVLFAT